MIWLIGKMTKNGGDMKVEWNLRCYTPENWSKLISKSAKMPGIGMTSLTLLSIQYTCQLKGKKQCPTNLCHFG